MHLKTLLLLFLAVLVSGCSSNTPQEAIVPEQVSERMLQEEVNAALLKQEAALEAAGLRAISYTPSDSASDPTLHPGMAITINTVEDEALNGTYEVPFEGPLKLPYNVQINAVGLSFSQVKKEIRIQYAPFFKIVPTMNISLSKRDQMIEVQGLVQKPGKVLVSASASLDEVLSKAGGLQTEGDGETKRARYVRVIPASGSGYSLSLQEYYAGVTSLDLKWRGGDRIFFQSEEPIESQPGSLERPKVQLLGQVVQPGAYPYRTGTNFFHYLVLAGGPTERTDFTRVEVVRLHDGERHSKRYDLTEDDVVPPVESGDIVIVHALKNNQTISNATAVLNSLATALLAAIAL
ncbi:MAG: SLBB domain-containing protein [Bdellovibrionales bacterium]|nr:SLBB domain-containing protein [Bdellovibrionales bacterium]